MVMYENRKDSLLKIPFVSQWIPLIVAILHRSDGRTRQLAASIFKATPPLSASVEPAPPVPTLTANIELVKPSLEVVSMVSTLEAVTDTHTLNAVSTTPKIKVTSITPIIETTLAAPMVKAAPDTPLLTTTRPLRDLVHGHNTSRVNIRESYCLSINRMIGREAITLSCIYKSTTRASAVGGRFGVRNFLSAFIEGRYVV